jgi:hypothetical protein
MMSSLMMQSSENKIFLGKYKGVSFYQVLKEKTHVIQCLFGWLPKEFQSVLAFKQAVTKWKNKDDSYQKEE